LHGKKGFERVVWAARNVLASSVVWLFCDLGGNESGELLSLRGCWLLMCDMQVLLMLTTLQSWNSSRKSRT